MKRGKISDEPITPLPADASVRFLRDLAHQERNPDVRDKLIASAARIETMAKQLERVSNWAGQMKGAK